VTNDFPPKVDNAAWRRVVASGLTLGLMTPSPMPARIPGELREQQLIAQTAEIAGFSALWCRDVPLMIPQEGNVSALDDPFVWLAMLVAATSTIAVGTAAAVLPLRDPLHLAKSALSLNRLSGGRLILGLGSGDRPSEFAAFGRDVQNSAQVYRDRWQVLRDAMDPARQAAVRERTGGYDIHVAPEEAVPMIVVGTSRQSLQWIAAHADGWASYHREEERQQGRIGLWQQALAQRGGGARPFIQSLNLDLLHDPDAPPEPIALGLRAGRNALLAYLLRLRALGVAHVIINIATSGRPPVEVIQELGLYITSQVS
jgi:luciferase-type oxidoreductase